MNDNTLQSTEFTHVSEFGRYIANLPPAFLILAAAVIVVGLLGAVLAFKFFKNRAFSKSGEPLQSNRPRV